MRPQARFDVGDGDALEEGGERHRESRQGVAVDQHVVGCQRAQRVGGPRHDAAHQFGQRLARGHDVQVGVGDDAEELEHAVELLAMLPGDEHHGLEPRLLMKGRDHRSHLDRFGSRPESDADALHPA